MISVGKCMKKVRIASKIKSKIVHDSSKNIHFIVKYDC